jgi:hypothetical protein
LCLQRCVRCIALFRLGYYKAQRDETMWVTELGQIVPVFLVEACQRREDQDRLLILDRRPRGRQVVHVVVYDGGCRVRSV